MTFDGRVIELELWEALLAAPFLGGLFALVFAINGWLLCAFGMGVYGMFRQYKIHYEPVDEDEI